MGHPAEAFEPRLVVAPVAVPRGLLVALRPRQWIKNAFVLLVHVRGLTKEPDRVLLTDRHLLASVAGFGVAAILVLQLS